jgi:hypothetical protein
MKRVAQTIFLIFSLSFQANALFTDSSSMSKDAKAQLLKFQEQAKSHNYDQAVSSSMEANEEALAFCEDKQVGPMSESVEAILKVGLHQYCDQYEDPERFCGCVGSITNKNYLEKKDLARFSKKVQEENLKNLAYSSMKALKDYKSYEIMSDLTGGRLGNSVRAKNAPGCGTNKEFLDSIKPVCTDDKILKLRDAYNMYTENCKAPNCNNVHKLDSFPRNEARFASYSPSELFVAHAGHTASRHINQLITIDYFKSTKLQEFGKNNLYTTINEVYEEIFVDKLAKRLKEYFRHGTSQEGGYYANDPYGKYEDRAMISALSSFELIKLDNKEYKSIDTYYYQDKKAMRSTLDKYFHQVEKQLFHYLPLNLKEMSQSELKTALQGMLDTRHANRKTKSCEKAIETFKTACSAIDSEEIDFDFQKNAAQIRENAVAKEDKFKFDQYYCVALGHNAKKISDDSNWYTGYKNAYKLTQSKDAIPFALNGSHGLDNNFSYNDGLGESDIVSLKYGIKAGSIHDYLTDSITGYRDLNANTSPYKPGQGPMNSKLNLGGDNSGVTFGNFNSGNFSFPTRYDSWTATTPVSGITSTDLIRDLDDSVKADGMSLMKEEIKNSNAELDKSMMADVKANLDNTINSNIPTQVEEVKETVTSNNSETNVEGSTTQLKEVSADNGFAQTDRVKSSEFATDENIPVVEASGKTGGPEANGNFNNFNDLSFNKFNAGNFKASQAQLADSKTASQEGSTNSEGLEVTTSDTLIEEEQDLEVQRLKLELEKMKLELAKTEREIEDSKTTEQAQTTVVAKPTVQAAPIAPAKTPTRAPASVSSVKSTATVSSSKPASSFSSSSSVSSAVSSSSPARAKQNQQSSTTSQSGAASSAAARGGLNSIAGGGDSSSSSAGTTGALLTATSISNEQIRSSAQLSPGSIPQVEASTEELSSYNQQELQELYDKFGEEILVEDEEGEAEQKVVLERDEETGIITVAKKEEEKTRAPASTTEEEPAAQRKRFSYDEFKSIIDSSRE